VKRTASLLKSRVQPQGSRLYAKPIVLSDLPSLSIQHAEFSVQQDFHWMLYYLCMGLQTALCVNTANNSVVCKFVSVGRKHVNKEITPITTGQRRTNSFPENHQLDMSNNCVFCSIIQDHAESSKVYEDNDVLAFLDIRPVNSGHILVSSPGSAINK
jgi:hypothetical protein